MTPSKIAQKVQASIVTVRHADGIGTGFIISEDGLIVTNHHVVAGARDLSVVLADGSKLQNLQPMVIDEERDLAILKASDAQGLSPVVLGKSTDVKAGERVVAIGNPMGLDRTVSDGLVSAVRTLSRDLTVLQISAPISPGSSGAPLFDEHGEVIGVVSAYMEGGQNLNFAIPVRYVQRLLDRKPAPVVVAASASTPAARIQRNVPTHEPSLFDGCSTDAIRNIARSISDAISVGAPAYNAGKIDICFHVYQGTLQKLKTEVADCKKVVAAIQTGLDRADATAGYDGKAWALRDTFDGLLMAIAAREVPQARKLPQVTRARNVPRHPKSILEGCTPDVLDKVVGAISSAIDIGAPAYNEGDVETCFRIYEQTALSLDKRIEGCHGLRNALLAGVEEAKQYKSFADKAWAMRDAFDGVLEVTSPKAGLNNIWDALRTAPAKPSVDPKVLRSCTSATLSSLRTTLHRAIDQGAPVYDQGDPEGCYKIYSSTAVKFSEQAKCADLKQFLLAEVAAAGKLRTPEDRAWALRDTFDALLEEIDRLARH